MSFLSCLFKPLAYVSPIIFAAWFTPMGHYYLRIGIYVGCVAIGGSSGAFTAIPLAIAGRKYDLNYMVARTFYWLATRALNITVELEGEEYLETRPAVMVGNHQSMVDIMWLGRCVQKSAGIESHGHHLESGNAAVNLIVRVQISRGSYPNAYRFSGTSS
jgi:lysophosphatidate acyltransferase